MKARRTPLPHLALAFLLISLFGLHSGGANAQDLTGLRQIGEGTQLSGPSAVNATLSAGTITTVAGNGTAGYGGDGGPATNASLLYPYDAAVDTSGNLYIADTSNSRIRRVDNSGTITTLAGNGTPGFSGDEGPATNASLYWPSSVAVDMEGNVYIADTWNNRVRKVGISGVITTVAGNGTSGYSGDGGPATSASLSHPMGLAMDEDGDLYIGDTWNSRVRKVDASGMITTVAGNGTAGYAGDGGPATSGRLGDPWGVAVDASGNLYIADHSSHRVRKVDSSGTITTFAGNGSYGYSGDGGPASSASLYYPEGLAVDADGNLYIADTFNQRIRKVDVFGTITTVAGNGIYGFSGDGGPATEARLAYPVGLGFNSLGDLFVAVSNNNRIREIVGLGPTYQATIRPPIAADGSSVFHDRAILPVKFTLTLNSASTCTLPQATISVRQMDGAALTSISQDAPTSQPESYFRTDLAGCQYIYNLAVNSLAPGTYQVNISIGGYVIGSARFALY